MERLSFVCLVALGIVGGCGESPPAEAPSPETEPSPVLLVSQKASATIAWYTLEGELLDEVSVSAHPHEIVLSSDGSRLYVTDNGVMRIENAGDGGNKVSIIDLDQRARIEEIDLKDWRRPHGIDLCGDGTLLVTSENPDQLLIIDTGKREIEKTYGTGGETPHIVRCSRDSAAAYVSNARSRTVAKIDLATGERQLLETGERPEGSALSNDGSKLFVVHRDADKIVVVDTAEWKVVGEFETGDQPVRCGLTADEKTLVYALLGDERIGIADLEQMEQTATIDLAGPPVSLEMHQDGITALTCAQDVDMCYVISVAERRILHTINMSDGAGPDPALLLR